MKNTVHSISLYFCLIFLNVAFLSCNTSSKKSYYYHIIWEGGEIVESEFIVDANTVPTIFEISSRLPADYDTNEVVVRISDLVDGNPDVDDSILLSRSYWNDNRLVTNSRVHFLNASTVKRNAK